MRSINLKLAATAVLALALAVAAASAVGLTLLPVAGPADAAPTPSQQFVALEAFVATEAAQAHAQAAKAAASAHPPTTVPTEDAAPAISKIVKVGGKSIAVVAFASLGTADPVQVLTYRTHGWVPVAQLPPPNGGGTAAGGLYLLPNSTIAVSNVIGDPNPAFLISLSAADNTPGAVLTMVGTHWRYVTFAEPFTKSQVVGRNPRFARHTVISFDDNCRPNCADGKISTIVWHYHSNKVEFEASTSP